MKHLKLFEDYKTSIFRTKINGNDIVLYLYVIESNILEVYLMLDNDIYDNLSVEIPESINLNNDEFFLNPDIEKEIVDSLVEQGFISKGEKKSKIGPNTWTYSYNLV